VYREAQGGSSSCAVLAREKTSHSGPAGKSQKMCSPNDCLPEPPVLEAQLQGHVRPGAHWLLHPQPWPQECPRHSQSWPHCRP